MFPGYRLHGLCITRHNLRCRKHVVWTSVSATCSLLMMLPVLAVACIVWPRKGETAITLGRSSNRSSGNFNILEKHKQYPENPNFQRKVYYIRRDLPNFTFSSINLLSFHRDKNMGTLICKITSNHNILRT